MYFFNSDGAIISYRKNDTDFGWWFKDINIPENNYKNSEKYLNICIEKVRCVQHQDVFLNICYDCGKYEKDNVYIPPIKNILEFINDNISKEKLLLGILSPGLWKQLNCKNNTFIFTIILLFNLLDKYTRDNNSDCHKFNSGIDENKKFEEIHNNYIFDVKLKPYTDEPLKILIIKLCEIDKLINSFKEEMNEMRQSLSYLRYCQKVNYF